MLIPKYFYRMLILILRLLILYTHTGLTVCTIPLTKGKINPNSPQFELYDKYHFEFCLENNLYLQNYF